MICRSVGSRLIEGWKIDQLSQPEAGCGDCAAKGGGVVLIAAARGSPPGTVGETAMQRHSPLHGRY